MRNLIIIVLAAMSLASCDNYEIVPEKTERIALMRPYEFINREEGVKITETAFLPGKRNHGNGPCIAYDFDMSIQTVKYKTTVWMADNIEQPFEVTFSYAMLPGKSLDAALNFLPVDSLKDEDGETLVPSGSNSVQVTKVPISVIYARNMYPLLALASRDVIDQNKSESVNIVELSDKIKRRANEIMASVQYPRVILGPDGKPKYDTKQKIAITDVMQLVAVTFSHYEQPEIIRNVISQIEENKNTVDELKEQKNQKNIQKQQKIYEAQKLAEITNNTKRLLAENPQFLAYKKYESLKKMLEKGNNHNTEVVFIPLKAMDRYQFTQPLIK